jgi:glycosyltransferase involved in cell wall biosynthesis
MLEDRRHRLDESAVVSPHETAYAAHEALYPSGVRDENAAAHPSATSTGSGTQSVVAPRGAMGADARLDVLVHAAAQLCERVRFKLPAIGAERERLLELAAAYGIGNRVEVEEVDPAPGDVLVHRDLRAPRRLGRHGHDPSLGWRVEGGRAETGSREVRTIAELIAVLGGAREGGGPATPELDRRLASQRIAVLTNVPNHYRVPLWNALNRRLHAAGAALRVLFSRDAAVERPWVRHEAIEFDHGFLRLGAAGFPVDLERQLRDFRPTLVLSGGFSPLTTGRALHFAAARGIPFGVWSGDTNRQAATRGPVRRMERRWILRRADYAIAYGWLAAEYLRELSPELPAVIGRNSAPFLAEAPPRSGGEAVEFLAVGQAIPRKGLDVVVDAFRLLGDDVPCRLTVAGGGPELGALVARARGDGRIRFLGAVESDRVLDCYRRADAFLFPSRSDVFGLVLVEAMGSGLATITASAPASVADLAVSERNCLVLDNHDPRAWAQAIRRLTEDTALRRRLTTAGRRTVLRRWTIEHSVDAWIAGLRLALLSAR